MIPPLPREHQQNQLVSNIDSGLRTNQRTNESAFADCLTALALAIFFAACCARWVVVSRKGEAPPE
jgi:hypothetical protein